jgi:hypothetical protein
MPGNGSFLDERTRVTATPAFRYRGAIATSCHVEVATMRPHAELHAIASHLSYEVEMLYATCSMIGAQGSELRINAMLESFALHARSLRHFLEPQGAQPDDVLAEHFFDSPAEWIKARGPMPQSLDRLRFRVGKEIAHLTYHRAGVLPEAKVWPMSTILFDLGLLLKAFAISAPREALPDEWRQRLLAATNMKPTRLDPAGW